MGAFKNIKWQEFLENAVQKPPGDKICDELAIVRGERDNKKICRGRYIEDVIGAKSKEL